MVYLKVLQRQDKIIERVMNIDCSKKEKHSLTVGAVTKCRLGHAIMPINSNIIIAYPFQAYNWQT